MRRKLALERASDLLPPVSLTQKMRKREEGLLAYAAVIIILQEMNDESFCSLVLYSFVLMSVRSQVRFYLFGPGCMFSSLAVR